ncbi:MAG: hypothetical protein AB1665_03040 [Candidatus Thermoplasmatota archaeon]
MCPIDEKRGRSAIELDRRGKGRRPRGYWEKRANRVRAVRRMLEELGKRPSEIRRRDFNFSGLSGLLGYHKGSLFAALADAGFALEPEDRCKVPDSYWDIKENRVRAIRKFVEDLRKPPEEVTWKDFKGSRCVQILHKCGSLRRALREAGYDVPYESKKTRRPRGYWDSRETRIMAVREMVEKAGIPPSEIGVKEFVDAGIQSLLVYCGNSPALALEEAGYPLTCYGHKRKRRVPRGYWAEKKHRIAAIGWLIDHLKKDPSRITAMDFYRERLHGLLVYYGGSARMALMDAGYVVPHKPRAPDHYWDDRENRVKAIRRMVQLKGNRPEAITPRTFEAFQLGSVLRYYRSSVARALKDAGYPSEEFSVKPQGFWKVRANRIEAVREMVKRSGKSPEEIKCSDFHKAGIARVMMIHGSHLKALTEAGYDIKPWRMERVPRDYWENKENRIAATRWLVERLGKDAVNITREDFRTNHLWSLLMAYSNKRCATYERGEVFTHEPGYLLQYPTRAIRALVEAGFDVKLDDVARAHHVRGRGLRGYWQKRERRIAAVRQVVEDVGNPREVATHHFRERGVSALLNYYGHSVFTALRDAGYDLRPWERHSVQRGYWKAKENRIAATRWMVDKLGGDPRKIKKEDFEREGLASLLSLTGGVLGALTEAGYDLRPWEGRNVQNGYWAVRENRIAATKWLVASLMKEPSKVTVRDFKLLGLGGLVRKYGKRRLLAEAGYTVKSGRG